MSRQVPCDSSRDDKYSDFQPTWSPDGSTIAFMSDRGRKTNFESLEYDKPLLAFLDFETAQVTTLSVFGAGKHMNPQYAPDGRSIYFVSDQDGFSDIYQYVLHDRRRTENHEAPDRREWNLCYVPGVLGRPASGKRSCSPCSTRSSFTCTAYRPVKPTWAARTSSHLWSVARAGFCLPPYRRGRAGSRVTSRIL